VRTITRRTPGGANFQTVRRRETLRASFRDGTQNPLWRTKGENARLLSMAVRPKLTPVQVLERLQLRLEKRMEALQRVKLAGFDMVIAELEVELDLLRRATRYLED
jgi:hypothetical protein